MYLIGFVCVTLCQRDRLANWINTVRGAITNKFVDLFYWVTFVRPFRYLFRHVRT